MTEEEDCSSALGFSSFLSLFVSKNLVKKSSHMLRVLRRALTPQFLLYNVLERKQSRNPLISMLTIK